MSNKVFPWVIKSIRYGGGKINWHLNANQCNLDKDVNSKDVDVKQYRGTNGSLIYMNASRSGIMFSICMCTRYQSTPKESHLKEIKHILKYLCGTSKYGLWYSKGRYCSLVGYFDFDFATCKSDRKSTGGTCHMFSNSLVSWHRKKQVFFCIVNGWSGNTS